MIQSVFRYGEGLINFFSTASPEEWCTYRFMLSYESVRKQYVGMTFYQAIPRGIDPRKHKRWRQFEKGREFCDLYELEYESFIVAQFIQMRTWKACPVPMPNHLYGEGALDRYSQCAVRWKKVERMRYRPKSIEDGTVEYYDELVRVYRGRMAQAGIEADLTEYLILMLGAKVFPTWYVEPRVPNWKERLEQLGFRVEEL